MINNIQNTNFKSSKIVVSRTAYNALPLNALQRQGKSVDDWTLKGAKFLKSEGFTSNIQDCTAGIFKAEGGDEFYMFHFDPKEKAENHWENLERTLLLVRKKLLIKNPLAPLETLLVGAKVEYKSSVDQAWNLLNFFQDMGAKVSCMLFQPQNAAADLHYSLPENKMTLCFNSLTSPRNMDELEYRFSNIMVDEKNLELRGD